MRRTVLHSVQLERGARFEPAGEWEIAYDFGDPIAEHLAARAHAVLIDRTPRGCLVVTGPDRFSWLQGMVSGDVRILESGKPSLCACVLNAAGHLLADVTLVQRPGSLLLDMAWENRDRIREHLERFLISEDVTLQDASDRLACLSLQGPQADRFLESTREWVNEITAGEWTINRADHTGEGGSDLYLPAERAAEVWEKIASSGIAPAGFTAAESLRIEAGIPRYGADMDEKTIPLECGLGPTHISNSKGCYIGQEIIARIQSRGHTNRALTGFLVEGARLPCRGERILPSAPIDGDAAREIGWITSSTHSPTLQRSIAIGYLRHEYRSPGAHLRTSELIPIEVHPLPFFGHR